VDNDVDLTQYPLGDYTGASEHADNGVTDLFSAGDHLSQDQPSHDGTVGSRQSDAAVPEGSFTDHRAEHTGDIGDLWLQDTIHLKEIKTMVEFVTLLWDASLDDPSLGMSSEALERL
jgi:hypothetical protein